MREDYGVLYGRIHKGNRWFSGYTGCQYAPNIKALVDKTGAESILDYGCGKGYQYLKKRIHEVWGILPYCYDIGVLPLSEKPDRKFDGVICTDMMEHIAMYDVGEVLSDVFSFAEKFVFLSICTRASGKVLQDGRGVHLTVKPERWWNARIKEAKPEGLEVEVVFSGLTDFDRGTEVWSQ